MPQPPDGRLNQWEDGREKRKMTTSMAQTLIPITDSFISAAYFKQSFHNFPQILKQFCHLTGWEATAGDEAVLSSDWLRSRNRRQSSSVIWLAKKPLQEMKQFYNVVANWLRLDKKPQQEIKRWIMAMYYYFWVYRIVENDLLFKAVTELVQDYSNMFPKQPFTDSVSLMECKTYCKCKQRNKTE